MAAFYADGGDDDDIGNLGCYREGPIKDYPLTFAEVIQWNLNIYYQ